MAQAQVVFSPSRVEALVVLNYGTRQCTYFYCPCSSLAEVCYITASMGNKSFASIGIYAKRNAGCLAQLQWSTDRFSAADYAQHRLQEKGEVESRCMASHLHCALHAVGRFE